MKICNQEILFKIHLKKDRDNPAMLTLFIGPYQIKGFAIRKAVDDNGKESLYLTPPSKRAPGRWFKLFWTEKEKWDELEKLAIEEFNKETSSEKL